MFERILYPTDFSPAAEKAAEKISAIPGVKEIQVLFVIDTKTFPTPKSVMRGIGPKYEDVIADRRKNAGPKAEKIAEAFRARGMTATSAVVVGDQVSDAIFEVARDYKPTAIVIGAFGKGASSGFVLGSTSDKVIRKSTIPVLVVKD